MGLARLGGGGMGFGGGAQTLGGLAGGLTPASAGGGLGSGVAMPGTPIQAGPVMRPMPMMPTDETATAPPLRTASPSPTPSPTAAPVSTTRPQMPIFRRPGMQMMASGGEADAGSPELKMDPELFASAQRDTENSRHKHDLMLNAQGSSPGMPMFLDQFIQRGRVPENELREDFKGTREHIRKKYGNHVTLHRADAPRDKHHPDTKHLLFADREMAGRYAAADSGRIVRGHSIPVDDILAVHAPKGFGDYHEFVVKKPQNFQVGGTPRTRYADGGNVATKLHTGPIHSMVAGRTDHLPIHVPSGSYVIPADIISAMGEGNTMAGFKHMRRIFGGMPYAGKAAPYDGEKEPYGEALPKAGGGAADDDYRISHRPMTEAGGAARLHELEKSFGPDIYGPKALQYFGSGDPREREVHRIMKAVRGKPHAKVRMFRGAPKAATKINAGDWVTLHRGVAQDYADLENGHVLSEEVPASHLTSWADSLAEFGYHPPKDEGAAPKADGGSAMRGWVRDAKAEGGTTTDDGGGGPPSADQGVPIVAAGGEYVLSPQEVMHAGGGDLDTGHRVLDEFVKRMRAQTVKTLSKLPGPKKD